MREKEYASRGLERDKDTRVLLEQALFQTLLFPFSSASCRRCTLFSTLSFAPFHMYKVLKKVKFIPCDRKDTKTMNFTYVNVV